MLIVLAEDIHVVTFKLVLRFQWMCRSKLPKLYMTMCEWSGTQIFATTKFFVFVEFLCNYPLYKFGEFTIVHIQGGLLVRRQRREQQQCPSLIPKSQL